MSLKPSFELAQLAERVSGKLSGDGSVRITGVASLRDAGPGELSLYADPRYRRELSSTRAGALLSRDGIPGLSIPQILHPDPFLALGALVDLFHPRSAPRPGVHELAWISPSARLGDGVSVSPFVHVSDGVAIGARSVVHSGVFLGENVTLGEDCVLWTNVVVREGCSIGNRVLVHPGAVLGSDGFGFARRDEKFVKIRHVGTVVVEDDVEIGANAAIDRGTLGATRIRRGVKIDNLVHIAHNVDVGEDSAMAAQVGISGSTVIGKRVLMGGQAGLVDHLTIGDGAILIAQSGVIGDVKPGETISGYPARPHREVLRDAAELRSLSRLKKRVRELEDEVRALKSPKR